MFVGICILTYYFPEVENLKAKRSRLNSIKDVLKRKYNISIAEVDYENLWQRTVLGISMVSNDKKFIDKNFSKIISDVEKLPYGYLNDIFIDFLSIGEKY